MNSYLNENNLIFNLNVNNDRIKKKDDIQNVSNINLQFFIDDFCLIVTTSTHILHS